MEQELIFKKKRIVSEFLGKNIILSPDLFEETVFEKTK